MEYDEDDDGDGDHDGPVDSDDEDLEEEQIHDDYQLDDMLNEDLNWELEITKKKKLWKQKEEEMRSEGAKSEESTLHPDSANMKTRQPKQVFTSAGASGILINDLVNIMMSARETNIIADSVGDNIFQWNVKLSNFDPESALQKECEELKQRFGYNYIELQLDFSMDLYPFFPPLVKVIRPRLQGSMMMRVTTMEILKLTYWSPARDMKSILLDIKQFLTQKARLDLSSERNDRSRYPGGAYIDIEHHLLRLALVSEVTPRVNKKLPLSEAPQEIRLSPDAFEDFQALPDYSEHEQEEDNHDDDDEILMQYEMIKKMMKKKAGAGGSNPKLHPLSQPKATVEITDNEDKISEDPDAIELAPVEPEAEASPQAGPSGAAGGSGGSGGAAGGKEVAAASPSLDSAAGVSSTAPFLSCMPKFMKKKKEKEKDKKTFAKGTGYSSYHTKGWDIKAYEAAIKEKDRQTMLVLNLILEELKKCRRITSVRTRNLPDLLTEAAGPGSSSSGIRLSFII